jgi:DNA-binding XRE family transcriptional regulator
MCLVEWRNSAGMTQSQLAKVAGVHRSAVCHVERKRYPPTVRFAVRVCRAISKELGTSVATWMVFPESFKAPAAQGEHN